MNTPQWRPGAGEGRPRPGSVRPGAGARRPAVTKRTESAEMLDRLVKDGKITTGQAAQYRVWESARPAIDAGRARFDAWVAARPNIPGMETIKPPTAETGKTVWTEMEGAAPWPRPGRATPPFPTQERMLETVTKFERENKITEAQAELVRRWERKRPGTAVGSESFEAWMKIRPDVPGLKEFWGDRP